MSKEIFVDSAFLILATRIRLKFGHKGENVRGVELKDRASKRTPDENF
jgi:hypothetical protein